MKVVHNLIFVKLILQNYKTSLPLKENHYDICSLRFGFICSEFLKSDEFQFCSKSSNHQEMSHNQEDVHLNIDFLDLKKNLCLKNYFVMQEMSFLVFLQLK